jgi:tetratricopeptide (TPR) repeat protein
MHKTILIENYISGTLSEVQQKELENLMITDNSFIEEIKLYREVDQAILDDDLHKYRQKVKDLCSDPKSKTSGYFRIKKNLIKLSVAASIIFLIGISLWQIIVRQSPDKIYTSFYRPYEADFSIRSSEIITDKIQLSYMLYQKGDYETCFNILDNYLARNYDNFTARFFYGMSALELGKTKLAIEQLSEVESNVSTPYSIHARWYLSMVYLKTDNLDLAKKYLNILVAEDNFYSEKAKSVLESLGS